MEFHEIDCVGNIWIERVATLPAHVPADKGRLVYNNTDNKIYYGNVSAWTEVGAGGGAGVSYVLIKDINMDGSDPASQGTIGVGVACIEFPPTGGTQPAVWFQFLVPEGHDPGDDLFFTISFTGNTSETSKTVSLKALYLVRTAADSLNFTEGTMSGPVEETPLVSIPNTAYDKATLTMVTIKIPNADITAVGDQVIVKLFRDNSDADDTYNGTFQLVDIAVHQ